MTRLAIAILATTACAQPPPAAPECDQPVRVGLSFEDTPGSLEVGYVMPTAVGGMQAFAPNCAWEATADIPLAIPYTATMTGSALAVDHIASEPDLIGDIGVFLRGVELGQATLAIGDPNDATPWFTFGLQADTIDHVSFAPSGYFTALQTEWYPTATSLAFVTGTTSLQVLLSGSGGEPIVDDTVEIASHGKIEPRMELGGLVELGPPPPAGEYPLDVTAGGEMTTVPLVIVDHADAIEHLVSSQPICFAATHDGYAVTGLSWTFTIDGQTAPSEATLNCIDVDDNTTTVTAHADGLALTVQL